MQENQRIMLTKRLLKEGLVRLLQHKPLDKIGITELCQESGINRATFYRHYELPRNVLNDIREDMIADMRKQLGEPTQGTDIKAYLEQLFTYLYERVDLLRLFLNNDSDQDASKMFDVFYQDVLRTQGVVEQASRNDPDSTKLMYLYIVGGMWTLLRHWLMDDVRKTPREIAEIAYEVANGNFFNAWAAK